MSKKLANLYTQTKSRWDKGQFVFVEGKDGTLFSQGTYPTKVTVGDLPDFAFAPHWMEPKQTR